MNPQASRFFKLALCAILAVTLAACGNASAGSGDDGPPRRAAPADPNAPAGNTVHMDNTTFKPDSVTIPAGTSLTLVADTFVPHFIANGTWEGNVAKPGREPGAPEIPNVQIDGNQSGSVGPFVEPGTFQLYCTIHPGMNLAVTVE